MKQSPNVQTLCNTSPIWINHLSPVKHLTILIISILAVSCNRDTKSSQVNKETRGEIRRYEVALFNIDTNRFEQGIAKIHPRFQVFLGETIPDEYGIQQLKDFVTDPMIRSTYNFTMKRFPDLDWLTEGLNTGFRIYKDEFPEKKIPQVYTYVSGYDIQMPIKYGDSVLIIGLDLYLGSDYQPYREMGYPVYITQRLTPDHILPDCFKEIGWASIPESKSATLLDAMIEQGKSIYFAEVMLPDEKTERLVKYTPEELQWVISNEKELWSFIIENQLIYSTDAKAITTFMTDGPFTSGFSDESPARTGHWLGWQIVRNYMSNNDVTLKELLQETDSQKILEQSGYKPGRI